MSGKQPKKHGPEKAQGIYAAVLTPFTEDLVPDGNRFVEHCRWLLSNGCNGLAAFGTTGEGVSLSVEDKIKLIETAGNAELPMERIIAGTGVCALGDAVAIARVAAAHDCEGVLCLPPFYYKNPDEQGLFEFYSRLVEKVDDPRLRIFLYHFPKLSTVPISMNLLERLIKRYPDHIVGLKDSSGDWSNTKMLLEAFPGFRVFSGSEQYLLDNLKAGGAGCISATTNLTAPQAQRVFTAWQNGNNKAEKLQSGLSAKRLALEQFPVVPVLKTIKSRLTGDSAWLRMLPPLVGLGEQDKDKLDSLLPGLLQDMVKP